MRLILAFILSVHVTFMAFASRDFVRASSQYGTLPAGTINGLLDGASGITVATWYNPSSVVGIDADDLIGVWHSSATSSLALRCAINSPTNGVPSGVVRKQSGAAISARNGNVTNPVVAGVWNHVAMTVSFGSFPEIWQGGTNNNGQAVGSATASGTFVASTLAASKDAIGGITKTTDGTPLNADRIANGQLAEFGIWSVALTADDIAALAAGASPLKVKPQSLVFYAPLGQASPEPQWLGVSISLSNSPAVGTSHPRIYR